MWWQSPDPAAPPWRPEDLAYALAIQESALAADAQRLLGGGLVRLVAPRHSTTPSSSSPPQARSPTNPSHLGARAPPETTRRGSGCSSRQARAGATAGGRSRGGSGGGGGGS